MSENQTKVVHSLPIAGLLGVAFVVLKLCHVINWSWWLVTLPFWGPPALVVAILLGVGLVAMFAALAVFFCGGRE